MEPEAAVQAARRLARLDPGAADGMVDLRYAVAEVERLIPHRAPFRFVDGVTGVDLPGQRIDGYVGIAADDPVFAGHFPGAPVFPGVLQVEAIGQLGLCLASFVRRRSRELPGDAEPPDDVRAVRVHHAMFLSPVGPGVRLDLYAEVLELDDFVGVVGGQARVDSTVCCSAVFEVYFV